MNDWQLALTLAGAWIGAAIATAVIFCGLVKLFPNRDHDEEGE